MAFFKREYVLLELTEGAHIKARAIPTMNGKWMASPFGPHSIRVLLPNGEIKSAAAFGNYIKSWEPLTAKVTKYYYQETPPREGEHSKGASDDV